jgi:hypothetical protein
MKNHDRHFKNGLFNISLNIVFGVAAIFSFTT